MCGITGWLDFQRDLSKQSGQITTMMDTLNHRGPDEQNQWTSTHVAFGHNRLIVVDPDGGKQPMHCLVEGNDYVLVYNGELYNTEDIKKELIKRGWTFASHSDTEVILKSYIEWEEACVDYFNGIFAFGIWDPVKEQLFLARDRLGVKPLFYAEKNSSFIFASELKAILAHRAITPILDSEGISELLALGPSRTPGNALFKGISELRAAHIGIVDKNGFRTRRYWNVKSEPHKDNLIETAEKVRFLLTDAVERQLVSDVPLGTFLSGGVDSSAITAIAANYLKREKGMTLSTFSIDYEENDRYFKKNSFQPNSDADFIGGIVDAHQTKQYTFEINNNVLADLLKEATIFRDFPGMADVDSSLLWFCQQTKKNVTVALSGECADEIFGGYPWFYREDDLNREVFPWIRSSEIRSSLLVKQFKKDLSLDDYMRERFEETMEETPLLDGEDALSSKRRQLFYLNMHWFMPTLLDRKDRMSMGASFEARVPFSDHRLVEYVWNIPWEMKTYQDREKGILRKALEGLLPNEILYRKKSPYPKTHHPDYTEAVINWMNAIITNKDARLFELFDRDEVVKLVNSKGEEIDTPWFGQLMKGPQLLAYLGQIDHWLTYYNIKIEQ
ncbi:asparagine synthase (glutamine-hydrolyzing) [Paraliobacillus salinarum]|uniref:asparagine synthase (glutamine-hydrolyzing) n=1 Tax=Paraliobacillus salinarum TaxID=1158996 RepID=UPI0015F394FA|nr:asparagine synthase (glutamine-hydrolyzing) [Paraliobacillus salinarum]